MIEQSHETSQPKPWLQQRIMSISTHLGITGSRGIVLDDIL